VVKGNRGKRGGRGEEGPHFVSDDAFYSSVRAVPDAAKEEEEGGGRGGKGGEKGGMPVTTVYFPSFFLDTAHPRG